MLTRESDVAIVTSQSASGDCKATKISVAEAIYPQLKTPITSQVVSKEQMTHLARAQATSSVCKTPLKKKEKGQL